jgi:hypothetical protein
MTMIRCAWLAGVLALCLTHPALGQAPELGAVRVVLAGGRAVIGQMVSAGPDSVVIRDGEGERLAYPASAIRRLDVRRPGSRWDNAAIGGPIGVLVSAVGMAIVAARTEYANADGREVFFATLGIPLGIVIGYALPPGTRWVRQPLPQVSWDGRAVHLGFSLRLP